MTAEHYISLLRRVRACIPKSALRYDRTLAKDIDAALDAAVGMGTVDVQYDALHKDDGIVLARLGDEG